MSEDESVLMAQVASGDRLAFQRLAERHIGPIESYALRTLADPMRAQDIAQEVMLRLWQRAGDYDSTRARLTTWLHQIAYNLCMDVYRGGARIEPLDEQAYEQVASDAESLDGDASVQAISKALAGLPERQRTALVLTYYQSLPNRDVAAIMGISVRALESLLVRARKVLRGCLEDSQ